MGEDFYRYSKCLGGNFGACCNYPEAWRNFYSYIHNRAQLSGWIACDFTDISLLEECGNMQVIGECRGPVCVIFLAKWKFRVIHCMSRTHLNLFEKFTLCFKVLFDIYKARAGAIGSDFWVHVLHVAGMSTWANSDWRRDWRRASHTTLLFPLNSSASNNPDEGGHTLKSVYPPVLLFTDLKLVFKKGGTLAHLIFLVLQLTCLQKYLSLFFLTLLSTLTV